MIYLSFYFIERNITEINGMKNKKIIYEWKFLRVYSGFELVKIGVLANRLSLFVQKSFLHCTIALKLFDMLLSCAFSNCNYVKRLY